MDETAAQDSPPPDDIPEPPGEAPPSDAELKSPSDAATGGDAPPLLRPEELAEARRQMWRDIVVVPHKPFLRRRRVELTPFIGSTVNDSLIQHTALGGELNYYLTDVLAIGAQGMYYVPDVSDEEFSVRYNFRRVATLNKYKYGVTGNFTYVPIYGKFAVMNKWIFHYDFWVSGGAGVTHTEVIPRDLRNEPFTNMSLTFPLGVGARLYVSRWLALQVAFRDYMMLDKFEQAGRTLVDGAEAKSQQSDTQFVNNLLLTAGVSFFLPPKFSYTTLR